MAQQFFSARDLWRYHEPDERTPKGPYGVRMVHAGFWKGYGALRIAGFSLLPMLSALAGAGSLHVQASVV